MPQRFGRPGLLGTIARTAVVPGTAIAVSNRVERRDTRRQAAAQPHRGLATAPPPPAPTPAPAGTDRVSQLAQLAELETQALPTEEELATEKARILEV